MKVKIGSRRFNKALFSAIVAAAAAIIAMFGVPSSGEKFRAEGEVEVYFSPRGGAAAAVVRELASAKSEVLLQAYSFTNKQIAKALVEAKKRGVRVEAIVDRNNAEEKYTEADFLQHSGVPTYIDGAHNIAHNKIIIIDRETVITGSFNFTKAAEEENSENLLVLRGNRKLADSYVNNYKAHRAHSEPYRGFHRGYDKPRGGKWRR